MPNMTVTNCDVGAVATRCDVIQDEILSFAAADTFVKGTLIARRTAASVSAGTVQGGTGTGTISAVDFVEGPVVPMAGAYRLECIVAVANGGVFQLLDPNGAVVAAYLDMKTASTGSKTFEAAGLTFTLTDATDFIVGNFFLITVVAGSKCVPYNPAGKGGEQFPIGVLLDEYTKAGSGDLAARVMVAGEVVKERLIIDVDGTGANITAAILDLLRSRGIAAVSVKQLSTLDNQ